MVYSIVQFNKKAPITVVEYMWEFIGDAKKVSIKANCLCRIEIIIIATLLSFLSGCLSSCPTSSCVPAVWKHQVFPEVIQPHLTGGQSCGWPHLGLAAKKKV